MESMLEWQYLTRLILKMGAIQQVVNDVSDLSRVLPKYHVTGISYLNFILKFSILLIALVGSLSSRHQTTKQIA